MPDSGRGRLTPSKQKFLRAAAILQFAQEIIELARNTEKAEREEHPLQRIMSVTEDGDALVITTTDVHLPRRIGHAIVDAYKGDLDTHYDRDGYFARIKWKRD